MKQKAKNRKLARRMNDYDNMVKQSPGQYMGFKRPGSTRKS